MYTVATIDRQPGSPQVAVWITRRVAGQEPGHVNAVVLDFDVDPQAMVKFYALTRETRVLVTDDTDLGGLPIVGEALRTDDLKALLEEIDEHQKRIADAVQAHRARTGSKLVDPEFPGRPVPAGTAANGGTPAIRALELANFFSRAWSSWLATDVERSRRTVHPKTGATPWAMPADMNDPSTPDFPPRFAAAVAVQPKV